MTVEFRYARADEYHRISKFFDGYWSKNYVYVRMPQLFQWTFGQKSLWEQDGYSFGLAEYKNEIVGILGAIPFTFNCYGKTSRAVWLLNYFVRPDYRSGLTAIRLLNLFSREPFELTATAGLNRDLIPLFRGLHWQVLDNFPRHFAVLPHAADRMANLLRLTYPDWQADRAIALSRFFTLSDLPETTVHSENSLPPSWNRRDWRQIAAATVGAVRDLGYLTWRYVEHPCFDYRLIALPERDRTGLAIWRLETIRAAASKKYDEVDRIGRLVEFLPASRNNARNLLALFCLELDNANALGADYYGYHGEGRRWLREFGFHGVETHPDGLAIPNRFQPLDHKGGRIVNALFARNHVPICSADAASPWYWTKSDCDQDRPN
jgi:hypothetical protein